MGRVHTHTMTNGRKVVTPKVGFYGCNGNVVRVALKKPERKPPPQRKIECPSCLRPHVVSLMWREAKASDTDKTPDVVLP